jgi:hypothetical protein
MNIFQQEIDDGLEETIKASASISYASLVEPLMEKSIASDQIISYKTLAGINDSDLYYVQSILVTSSWNKNDDIFDSLEIWNARATPNHKPTNLEHDESMIIGHITSNWPMTDDGVLIDENTPISNIPKKFHILTGSVIYTGFTDPSLKERASKLIAEIENGTKYVSMECFFKGFDYGLINKDSGEYKVLSRNEETSYLTKYLRSYGGVGEHENYKIGRVLRNITFSGKGFVNRPANPESVILSKDSIKFGKVESSIVSTEEKNVKIPEESVSNNKANLQETDMNLENQITELKSELELAKTQLAEANNQLQAKDAQTQEYLNKLGVTEEDKKKMKAELEEVLAQEVANKAKVEEEMKAQNAEISKKNEELQAALDTANETIAVYMKKEEEMMKKEKMMKRKASLMEAGLDEETVASTLEKFEALDDAAFDAVTSLVIAAKKVTPMGKQGVKAENTEEVVAEEQEETNKASETDTAILENAEPVEEVSLSVGSESAVSDIENTRAALVNFVYNRLGKKLNKGE